MKKQAFQKGDQVMIYYENYNKDGSTRITKTPAIYDRKEGRSHIVLTPSGGECHCGEGLVKAPPINAILTSKGTILLGPGQWIQETEKNIELLEKVPNDMCVLLARYRKANRWVSYDGGATMTMI